MLNSPQGEVPSERVRCLVDAPVNGEGAYVLYCMTAFRRTRWNFAFDRAVEWANHLRLPLLVFEPLRAQYEWATNRTHRFVIDGMRANAAACDRHGALYYPYIETEAGTGSGLFAALAGNAAVVIGDDYPAFFLPRLIAAYARQVRSRFEVIDANGVVPLGAPPKIFPSAYFFRRYLQSVLPEFVGVTPKADSLSAYVPIAHQGTRKSILNSAGVSEAVLTRWTPAFDDVPDASDTLLEQVNLPGPSLQCPTTGGQGAASIALSSFMEQRMAGYVDGRNAFDSHGSSGLSPYLHFGHLSSFEIVDAILRNERWSPDRLATSAKGKREGWWGMSASAEAFLDQLITWRELGFNMCSRRPDYDTFGSLPEWAQRTLQEHAGDPRPYVYSREAFETAATHDEVWNAAQRQLVREGRMHNYLRMLWAKKILHWTESPHVALDVMIYLNNTYALDGRDPNSYSGIFWCLGRYDRPWGPERPIFGKVRYMTSDSTRRKFKINGYLARYGAATQTELF